MLLLIEELKAMSPKLESSEGGLMKLVDIIKDEFLYLIMFYQV